MALIDGVYEDSERDYIESVINAYPEYQGQIYQAIDEFYQSQIKEEYISDLLKDCRKYLEDRELKELVKHSFKVLAIDGTVDDNEKFLIKSYLLAFGMPSNYFDSYIEKILLENKRKDEQIN
jgi:uncharacterized protein YaaW (UPF0174 family)